MAEIAAYLGFDGRTRKAMEFYKEAFGGELKFQTLKESPMASQYPNDDPDKIFHASLEGKDFVLMASDFSGPDGFIRGNTISLSLLCKSKKEIEELYEKLSEGGTPTMPLTDSEWNSIFGMVDDRFGITWLLNYDKDLG
jgi:PhnB protein